MTKKSDKPKSHRHVAAGKKRAETLTTEHQRMAGKARARQFSPAYQRFAQTMGGVARAEYRRNHPTELERRMIDWLAELGWHEWEDYQREKIIATWACDFVFETHRAIIEVNGQVWHTNGFHGQDKEGRDARKRADLKVFGWRLLEITDHEMRDKESVQTRLIQFLAGGRQP